MAHAVDFPPVLFSLMLRIACFAWQDALANVTPNKHRHWIPSPCKIVAHPILGGLHHEYRLLAKAA